MDRRIAWGLAVGGVLVAGAVAVALFAPQPSRTVAEAAPDGVALRSGRLMDGEPLHHAAGTVALLRTEAGHVLRFEAYDATPGPDVFFYLTPGVRASTTEAVEGEGVRVPTSGKGGQATLRGDFNVPLPEGFDPAAFAGLSVWCERYDVLFGWAELT